MNILEKIFEEIIDELKEEGIITDDDRGHRAVEIIVSHMDEIENDGWIPIEERLPEEKTEVLCCFEDGTVQSLWQNWKNDGLGDYFDDDLMPTEVIAWRSLPEPYKPKEKNNE